VTDERPVIVLIGGATGTGKSTVAAEVAHRLGITRVNSTDVVRQTLRAFFDQQAMPAVHASTFEGVPLLPAFLEQSEHVLMGVGAAIDRARDERWSIVVEGVHLVPGLFAVDFEDARVVQCVLSIEEEMLHAAHFWIRDATSGGLRPVERYLDHLDAIRRVQDLLVERALVAGVPVIENSNVERTVEAVLELVREVTEGRLERV
jgi:2-phosphoglycerate kinase